MSDEINLLEARQRMYLEELARCVVVDCDFYLEHNDTQEFLDYITNLQQENDRLNNIINKAIEYIDKCKTLSITDKKIILSISLLENILKENNNAKD